MDSNNSINNEIQNNNSNNNQETIKKVAIIGAVVLIVILVILAIFLLLKSMNKNNSTNSNQVEDSNNNIDNNQVEDKNDEENNNDFDVSYYCKNSGCTYIDSDEDLDNYSKLNSLDKVEKYADEIAVDVNIGGISNFKSSSANESDLFHMVAMHLGREYCFERNYVKDKVYELYNVNIDVSKNFTSYDGNYFCSQEGGGGSAWMLESKNPSVESNNYTWSYLYRSQVDNSSYETINIKFIYVDGLYKLSEVEINVNQN